MLALRAVPVSIMYLIFKSIKLINFSGKVASLVGIKIMENPKMSDKEALIKINKNILPLMVEKLLNRFSIIFDYNAGSLFKYLILICLEKMLKFSETENLRKLLNINQLALFMSRLIHHTDIMIIALTSQIIEILITKMPEIYIFLGREGVIQYIEYLSNEDQFNKLEIYTINNKKSGATNKSSLSSDNNMPNLNYLLQKHQGTSHKINNTEVEPQRFENIVGQLQYTNPYNNSGLNNAGVLPIIGSTNINQINNSRSLFPSNNIFNPQINSTKEQPITNNKNNNNSSDSNSNTFTTNTKDFSRTEAFLFEEKIKKDLLAFKVLKQPNNNDTGANKNSNTLSKTMNSTEKNDKFDLSSMEIESGSKPNPSYKNPELEKLDDIKKELVQFLKELYVKMQQIVENNKVSLNLPQATLFKITDISNLLLKGQFNPNEFGISIFEKYVSFINEYNTITKHEIKSSKLLKNLLKFLLDNALETKFTKPSSQSEKIDKIGSVSNNKKMKILMSPHSSSKKSKEEQKLSSPNNSTNSGQKDKDILTPPFELSQEKLRLDIDLTENECKIILARLMVFLCSFKKPSFQNLKGNSFIA